MGLDVHAEINEEVILRVIEKGIKKGLQEATEQVLSQSKINCPHDVGTLENSGKTKVQGHDGKVFYNTPYAARLHEHPEYNFQGKGRGKWLEEALMNNKAVIYQIVAENIGEAFL